MSPTAAVLRGILLGLGAAVPIGPVNVEIARRTLRNGFPAGIAIGCGAVTIDMLYALAVSVGVGDRLARSRPLSVALGSAGALLLTYLAWSCFRGARSARHTSPDPSIPATSPSPDPSALVRTYLTGLLMTATNPMTLAFWFLALPGIVGPTASRADLAFTCAGVGFGALAWVLTFSATLSLAGRFNRNTWVTAADFSGGVILLAFALLAAWRVLVNLTSAPAAAG